MTGVAVGDEVSATVPLQRRSRARRVGGWVAIAVALLVVGGVGGVLAGLSQRSDRNALDPDSAGPDGTRALVEILRDNGVDVVVARDRDAAATALAGRPATLVATDAPALSDGAIVSLAENAEDVVLVDPRARTLRLLLEGSDPAGFGTGEPTAADCALAAAERAGAIVPGAVFTPAGDGVVACYPSGDGYGLIASEDAGRSVSAVDGRSLFTNRVLADDGNAALAINLMGRHDLLVWYMPGPGDTDLVDGDPTLGDLTPPWVSPVIVLLLVAGVAAAVWRGRRFGPLVPERLPVTVRASETTEGRARLYARSRDAVHAADQLRIGALARLGRVLGLGAAASAPEISDAAADRLGWDRRAVRGILIDELPANDAQLVELRDRLRHLEEAVHRAVRPERNSP